MDSATLTAHIAENGLAPLPLLSTPLKPDLVFSDGTSVRPSFLAAARACAAVSSMYPAAVGVPVRKSCGEKTVAGFMKLQDDRNNCNTPEAKKSL